jgi:hypothetical protein
MANEPAPPEFPISTHRGRFLHDTGMDRRRPDAVTAANHRLQAMMPDSEPFTQPDAMARLGGLSISSTVMPILGDLFSPGHICPLTQTQSRLPAAESKAIKII